MAVLKLVRYPDADTIAVLEHVLARAREGKVLGVLVCEKPTEGSEEIYFTGQYKANSTYAAASALRLSIRLNSAPV